MLQTIIGKADILLITEIKLDNFFPSTQFLLDGFSPPYILDRNQNRWDHTLCRKNITSKLPPDVNPGTEVEN